MSDIEKELCRMALGECREFMGQRYGRVPGGWIVRQNSQAGRGVFVPDPAPQERFQRDLVAAVWGVESLLQLHYR